MAPAGNWASAGSARSSAPWWGAVRGGADRNSLYVGGAAVRRRRSNLLHRASTQRGAPRCASRTARRAVATELQAASERFVGAQGGNHLLSEQPDRAHEVALRQVGEIKLAHQDVEHARLRGGADLCGDSVWRANEHQIALDEIIGIEQVGHDLRGSGLAAPDEFLGVQADALVEALAGLWRR